MRCERVRRRAKPGALTTPAPLTPRLIPTLLITMLVTLSLAACGGSARLPVEAGMGEHPAIPAPTRSWLPSVALPRAIGWPAGTTPRAAAGLRVTRLAAGLAHPRWLYVLPNGDVLVAESFGPGSAADQKGLFGALSRLAMQRVGSVGVSADRITLLRGVDGSGAAITRSVFLSGLHSPLGMARVGENFYVANTDAVMKFPYRGGEVNITAPGEKVTALPAGARNHHWTKNLLASRDGTKLYVSVGSNSNVAENGMAAEFERACVWEVDLATGHHRIYASGLRNPVGMAWEPHGGALWTVVNERDELGNDVPPDYMTAVQDGGFYGWPYSYFGQHVDARVTPARTDLVARALVPDYALGPHTASLGLTFASGDALPPPWREGAFVGQHGSWNRRPVSGYQVLFIPFRNGRPAGSPRVVLDGFLNADGEAMGRPAGVAMDAQGALLVADDVGGTVWRVSAAR